MQPYRYSIKIKYQDNRTINIQTFKHTNIQTNIRTTYRHIDIQIYRDANLQTYKQVNIQLYTDMQIYRHKTNSAPNPLLQVDRNNLCTWCSNNKLTIIVKKTESPTFLIKRTANTPQSPPLLSASTAVGQVSHFTCLRTTLDIRLNVNGQTP